MPAAAVEVAEAEVADPAVVVEDPPVDAEDPEVEDPQAAAVVSRTATASPRVERLIIAVSLSWSDAMDTRAAG
ncbi:hypothetical protein GCM10027579_10060 [Calidifontibacter terrae]